MDCIYFRVNACFVQEIDNFNPNLIALLRTIRTVIKSLNVVQFVLIL